MSIVLYSQYARCQCEREKYVDLKKDNTRLEMKIDSLQRMNPTFR